MRLETIAPTVAVAPAQKRRRALVERITVDAIIVALIGLAFLMLATHV